MAGLHVGKNLTNEDQDFIVCFLCISIRRVQGLKVLDMLPRYLISGIEGELPHQVTLVRAYLLWSCDGKNYGIFFAYKNLVLKHLE
jgi:hypothetical protein